MPAPARLPPRSRAAAQRSGRNEASSEPAVPPAAARCGRGAGMSVLDLPAGAVARPANADVVALPRRVAAAGPAGRDVRPQRVETPAAMPGGAAAACAAAQAAVRSAGMAVKWAPMAESRFVAAAVRRRMRVAARGLRLRAADRPSSLAVPRLHSRKTPSEPHLRIFPRYAPRKRLRQGHALPERHGRRFSRPCPRFSTALRDRAFREDRQANVAKPWRRLAITPRAGRSARRWCRRTRTNSTAQYRCCACGRDAAPDRSALPPKDCPG